MLKHLTLVLLLTGELIEFAPGLAQAQQAAGETDVFAPVAPDDGSTTSKPTKRTKVAATPVKSNKSDPSASAGSGDVDQRLQQIEEQLADMQVAVGTMESMGKGRPASAGPIASSSDVDVRVGRLEAQMQNLNAQLAQLANEMRAIDAKLQVEGASRQGLQAVPPKQSGALTVAPAKAAAASGEQPALADTSFGKTTVSQGGQNDSPGNTTETMALEAPIQEPPSPGAPQVAALAPASNDPQAAYDQAYGLVLQQDYSGAEAAFRDYVGRFPQSPLASNANYWLGQSFFARGQYKAAADAFLRGYKTYRTGQKAPDSLLKVAMSLSRLGQRDLACSAFTALDGEFPNASVQIKHLAQTERDRAGC